MFEKMKARIRAVNEGEIIPPYEGELLDPKHHSCHVYSGGWGAQGYCMLDAAIGFGPKSAPKYYCAFHAPCICERRRVRGLDTEIVKENPNCVRCKDTARRMKL
jgi:hypothetical protein